MDSVNLWILRWILQNYLFWLFGVGKGKRTLLLAKAKSSKNFYAPRARFCEFVESSVDSAESWNRWLIEAGGERGLYFWDKQKVAKSFRFYGIVESTGWILWFCRIEGGICVFCVRFCGIVESLVDLSL